MISLDLPQETEYAIIQKAQNAGQTVERYLIEHITQLAQSKRELGGGEHLLVAMADDFDEPLDEFGEYM
ncbi:DUF2281 domain-containing protein [Moraxella sp. VT-16-12]|uniref:DUF2281 domain-containing protein n=1 Tax=Moraxella sp. VT-16-12 TaxID=2014877 RepID=UPI00117BE802|nr:DUF2281 domain-containing protein [Moraxella sp. VT-16-12]